ncbi:MAG: metal-dependent hydrolase [Candidatus Aenigmarchaeota archaeon]|nr:metal-dependent hydrolase [Candidatus Aenigmarchaeota archaeon]
MFILGHIGITAFLASILGLPILIAAISSQIPDLIDKPLFLLGIFPSGRYIGHTLLFVVLFGFMTYIITKRKVISIAVSFGMLMHLFQDLPYFIPWFYPFINYIFPTGPFEFQYTLKLFLLDLTGIVLLTILYLKNNGFKKEINDVKKVFVKIIKSNS